MHFFKSHVNCQGSWDSCKGFFQIVLLPQHASINWADPTQNCAIILQSRYGNGQRIKDVQITAAHIPGHNNINAHRKSSELSYDLEWMLYPKSLHKAIKILKFNPEADMFSSNINHQFYTYISYQADPKAKAVDSFRVSWNSLKFYTFPPFSETSRTLKKIKVEKAEGILLAKSSLISSVV